MRICASAVRVVSVMIIVALAACSPAPRIVDLQPDYSAYDRSSLVRDAVLVVEGVVVEQEYTVVKPRFPGGSNPQEDPLFGMTEAEKKHAIEQATGVASTLVTLRATAVHRGTVTVGEEVVIVQTGGVVAGVRYRVADEPPMDVGTTYLLFAKDSFDGAFAILGGCAGMYRWSTDQTYLAARPECAPFEDLTSAEAESLS